MTLDMLRGFNQLINKVAAAVPTNMRAPDKTAHDVLTQQAQTALHHQLSSSRTITNAENLELSLQGQQLIVRLPSTNNQDSQPATTKPLVAIPLTEAQVQLVKDLLKQHHTRQAGTLMVSLEPFPPTQPLATISIKIPAEQRNQIALALLVQSNQLTLSGQIQSATQSFKNLISVFVQPLDKVISVPLQPLPDKLQSLLSNIHQNTSSKTLNQPITLTSLQQAPLHHAALISEAKLADIQLAINNDVLPVKLNTQHVATQALLKTINQLNGGKLTLSAKDLTGIVVRFMPQESKQLTHILSNPLHSKIPITLSPQLDKLSMMNSNSTSSVHNTPNSQREIGGALRFTTSSQQTNIALPNQLISPLKDMIVVSHSLAQRNSQVHSPISPHPVNAKIFEQPLTTQTIRALLPSPIAQTGFNQAMTSIITHITTNPLATPVNSEQILAEVQELTQPDLAALVLNKLTHRQPLQHSPQATFASGLASMVQISLASKLQQQLSSTAKNTALEQHINTLITPYVAASALQQSNNKTPEKNYDAATELLQGITRLLTSHRLHQAVSLEWQAQHPDSQYFTLPNFLSGSKQPIQLLIKHERTNEADESEYSKENVQQSSNKWQLSLQFDIPSPVTQHSGQQPDPEATASSKLLAKATLQGNIVNISLYGSTPELLHKVNQFKPTLEQRLRQLGFVVEAQPAYQGVINDSLVNWPSSIQPSTGISV